MFGLNAVMLPEHMRNAGMAEVRSVATTVPTPFCLGLCLGLARGLGLGPGLGVQSRVRVMVWGRSNVVCSAAVSC